MSSIIFCLDKEGSLDDEHIAYNPKDYPFTLTEFRAYTDKVWNDAGGWDKSRDYRVKKQRFETYAVPFEADGKKYVMRVMYGQGSAWTLFTEAAHKEHEEYLKTLPQEDDDLFEVRYLSLLKDDQIIDQIEIDMTDDEAIALDEMLRKNKIYGEDVELAITTE